MNDFHQAIAAAGLGSPHIPPDGRIHRFTAPDDRPGSNNCWAVNYGTAGAFGSWKVGEAHKWHDGEERSANDELELARKIREAQAKRQAEIAQAQECAAAKAQRLWDKATAPHPFHPYLVRKSIGSGPVQQLDKSLVIPMYGDDLVNLQFIHPDGSKRFLKGGRKKGCYSPIGTPSGEIFIVEGYATGYSLQQETGAFVVVAFDSGNLGPVARIIRQKYPDAVITIAADNDWQTPGNPGLSKGREAALSIGCALIYPTFTDLPGDVSGLSDFNDYFSHGGEL